MNKETENDYVDNIKILSRKEAKSKDLIYYFTGKPCQHGHISQRYSRNGQCFSCQATKTSNYRKKNRKKIKKSKQKWSKDNQELRNMYHAKRRYLKTHGTSPLYSDDIKAKYALAIELSKKTGKKHDVDHIIPLIM